jgi:dihydropteroate synthase
LVGVSRKSFIGRLTGAEVGERLSGSLASTCLAVAGGAAVVRTHDVRETVQALRITEAILAKQRMTTS